CWSFAPAARKVGCNAPSNSTFGIEARLYATLYRPTACVVSTRPMTTRSRLLSSQFTTFVKKTTRPVVSDAAPPECENSGRSEWGLAAYAATNVTADWTTHAAASE